MKDKRSGSLKVAEIRTLPQELPAVVVTVVLRDARKGCNFECWTLLLNLTIFFWS